MNGNLLAQIANPLGNTNDFSTLLNGIIGYIYGPVMALATVMVVIAAILFITSAGNPGKVGQAKNALFFAIGGMIIVLVAGGLASQIKGVSSTTNDVSITLGNITSVVGGFIAVLGGVMVFVAGALYVTSAGSQKQMDTAKAILTYAIVGIVIGLSAKSIVDFFQTL